MKVGRRKTDSWNICATVYSRPCGRVILLLWIIAALTIQRALKICSVLWDIPLYLSPYSPDLNPIEKIWPEMNPFLRKLCIRSADLLPVAVREALAVVFSSDCDGWLRCAGY